jgi:hypothetical protein
MEGSLSSRLLGFLFAVFLANTDLGLNGGLGRLAFILVAVV